MPNEVPYDHFIAGQRGEDALSMSDVDSEERMQMDSQLTVARQKDEAKLRARGEYRSE